MELLGGADKPVAHTVRQELLVVLAQCEHALGSGLLSGRVRGFNARCEGGSGTLDTTGQCRSWWRWAFRIHRALPAFALQKGLLVIGAVRGLQGGLEQELRRVLHVDDRCDDGLELLNVDRS